MDNGSKDCMWDCEWKYNPLFKSILPWYIYNKTESQLTGKKEFQSVAVYMTAPRVPKNISCLEDCFVPEIGNNYEEYCGTKFNWDEEYSYSPILDCILYRRIRIGYG